MTKTLFVIRKGGRLFFFISLQIRAKEVDFPFGFIFIIGGLMNMQVENSQSNARIPRSTHFAPFASAKSINQLAKLKIPDQKTT